MYTCIQRSLHIEFVIYLYTYREKEDADSCGVLEETYIFTKRDVYLY